MLIRRSGVVDTLSALDALLPYPYVHLVYWTIQVMLAVYVMETGVSASISIYSKTNGKSNENTYCVFNSIYHVFFFTIRG